MCCLFLSHSLTHSYTHTHTHTFLAPPIRQHWRIGDFLTEETYNLIGRKDRDTFGRDMVWVGGPRALARDFQFPRNILILRAPDRLILLGKYKRGELLVLNASSLPLVTNEGPGKKVMKTSKP